MNKRIITKQFGDVELNETPIFVVTIEQEVKPDAWLGIERHYVESQNGYVQLIYEIKQDHGDIDDYINKKDLEEYDPKYY